MKAGDMVKLCFVYYPKQEGQIGILTEMPPSMDAPPTKWVVMIGSRIHPYLIDEEDMEVVSEGR